ncbi:MAG: hypothetical protein ABI194_06110 [Gemmatimonadaceae bacterium]
MSQSTLLIIDDEPKIRAGLRIVATWMAPVVWSHSGTSRDVRLSVTMR